MSCHFSFLFRCLQDTVLRAIRTQSTEMDQMNQFHRTKPSGVQSCPFAFSRCIKNELNPADSKKLFFNCASACALIWFCLFHFATNHVFLFTVFALALSISCLLFLRFILFSFTIVSVCVICLDSIWVLFCAFSVFIACFQKRYTATTFG